ncbi:cilia- and flagella-associated protein 77-like isoform X1 [Centruroides vittatus]|uniref:cilia- and flagella-associated protein 77-like isoform X1 n=2 Tax=Centruroides vittatus TaxID=120091 RepID=UPI0035102756
MNIVSIIEHFTMDTQISTYRKSMYHNPLLHRTQTAKRMTYCIRLPGKNFTYGVKNICLDGGVAEALGNWHKGTLTPSKSPGKNFVKINYDAAKFRATNVMEQKYFREEFCKGEKYLLRPQKTFGTIKIPDIIFGKPNKYDENISLLLQNAYFHRWFDKMKKKEVQKRNILPPPNFIKDNILKNRMPILPPPAPVQKPWKMARFIKIGHRVDCWNRACGFQPTSVRKPIVVDEDLIDKKPCMCDENSPPINIDQVLETTWKENSGKSEPVPFKLPSIESEAEKKNENLHKWILPPGSHSVPTSKLTDKYRKKSPISV